jgi:hypothetical protein
MTEPSASSTLEVAKNTFIVVLVIGSCWVVFNFVSNISSCETPFGMQGYPRTPLYSLSNQGDENFSSYNQKNRLPGTLIDSNNGCQPYPPYADPSMTTTPTQSTQGWIRNGVVGSVQGANNTKKKQGSMNPRVSLSPYNAIGNSSAIVNTQNGKTTTQGSTTGFPAPLAINTNTGARSVLNSYADFGNSAIAGTGNNPSYSSFGTGPNPPLTEGDIVETNRDVTNPNGIMVSTIKDLPQNIFTYPNQKDGTPTYPHQGARITYPLYDCPQTIPWPSPYGATDIAPQNPISPSMTPAPTGWPRISHIHVPFMGAKNQQQHASVGYAPNTMPSQGAKAHNITVPFQGKNKLPDKTAQGDTRAFIGCVAPRNGQLNMLCSYNAFGVQGDTRPSNPSTIIGSLPDQSTVDLRNNHISGVRVQDGLGAQYTS